AEPPRMSPSALHDPPRHGPPDRKRHCGGERAGASLPDYGIAPANHLAQDLVYGHAADHPGRYRRGIRSTVSVRNVVSSVEVGVRRSDRHPWPNAQRPTPNAHHRSSFLITDPLTELLREAVASAMAARDPAPVARP